MPRDIHRGCWWCCKKNVKRIWIISMRNNKLCSSTVPLLVLPFVCLDWVSFNTLNYCLCLDSWSSHICGSGWLGAFSFWRELGMTCRLWPEDQWEARDSCTSHTAGRWVTTGISWPFALLFCSLPSRCEWQEGGPSRHMAKREGRVGTHGGTGSEWVS